jgi:hypothetical protein
MWEVPTQLPPCPQHRLARVGQTRAHCPEKLSQSRGQRQGRTQAQSQGLGNQRGPERLYPTILCYRLGNQEFMGSCPYNISSPDLKAKVKYSGLGTGLLGSHSQLPTSKLQEPVGALNT